MTTDSPDTSSTELKLEREKIALEREMLSLERERLAAERAQWQLESGWNAKAASGLQIGMGVFGLALATALLVGIVAGYNTGLSKGKSDAAIPRRVLISPAFLKAMDRSPKLPALAPEPSAPPLFPDYNPYAIHRRTKEAAAFGTLPFIR